MTRPPKPKYPSDAENYHKMRRSGYAHTIRDPEELLERYSSFKHAIGPKNSHADVMQFFFYTADTAINVVVQSAEARMVQDSQIHDWKDVQMEDPDKAKDELHGEFGDNTMSSDNKTELELRLVANFTACGDDVVSPNSQQQPNRNAQLQTYPDAQFDSSRSEFHGALPVINIEDDRVIEKVTLTRKQTGLS
ncbi:hypothetical protein R1sor_019520 [Riccia sorocarpa]|uniref:Uncharacterized protein n=1 Tax=Riccia sorocarpa TaxID=122646 RepID=A0ABD3ICR2_9MARC